MAEGPTLILASSSPRRAEILTSLGIPFTVDPSGIEEEIGSDEAPEAAAGRLAGEKAAEVALRHPGAWVLGADTIVVVDATTLGKPRDPEDAARMLRLLSGRSHRVVTGVRLRRGFDPGRELIEESRVRMAPMTEEEIAWYVATTEPCDKAGSYAVQGLGARFIEAVEGSFTNVMGLPARGVYRLLRDAGDRALSLLALSCPST